MLRACSRGRRHRLSANVFRIDTLEGNQLGGMLGVLAGLGFCQLSHLQHSRTEVILKTFAECVCAIVSV